jgi:hypothetical protein
MNISNRFAIRFTALAVMVLLGGCLSSEEPETAAAPEPVAPSNRAPTISGNPNTSVLMGEQYSFTPSASDADNDPLTFSVQGEPSWLTINSGSGALTGTPTLADVGSYSGIVVSVSDGSASASLPQFGVDVVQNADGSVTLTWTAPTLNEDGSALTDLAGYKIYYGTSPGNYPNQIRIDGVGMTTQVVNNLTPDTYYFVATAFNTAEIESGYSGEAIKTVN